MGLPGIALLCAVVFQNISAVFAVEAVRLLGRNAGAGILLRDTLPGDKPPHPILRRGDDTHGDIAAPAQIALQQKDRVNGRAAHTGGFGICLGQRCGAKDEKGMRKSVAVSTILSIAFTVVLTLLCCLFAHEILYLMQIPSDISGEAYDYMFVVLLGTGATVFYNMISNMLRALGDSKTPLYFLVFSSILNIFLDLFFILVVKAGVQGAAVATVLSQTLAFLICWFYMIRRYEILRLKKEDFTGLDRNMMKNILPAA